MQTELNESQRRRAELEAKEQELQALLDTHTREHDATATDFAEMEEMGRKKVRDLKALRSWNINRSYRACHTNWCTSVTARHAHRCPRKFCS